MDRRGLAKRFQRQVTGDIGSVKKDAWAGQLVGTPGTYRDLPKIEETSQDIFNVATQDLPGTCQGLLRPPSGI